MNGSNSPAILIAEDDKDISDIYSFVLRDAGYTVLLASSGTATLEAAKQQPPGVVLLDIMMPGIDGVHVLEALRNDPAYNTNRPIIIVMTNLNRQDIKDRVKELGADGYVVKADIAPQEIVAIVKQALERYATPS